MADGLFAAVTAPTVFHEVRPEGQFYDMVSSSAAVGSSSQCRVRFNGSALQVSINGAAYADLVTVAPGGGDFSQGGDAFGTTAILGTTDNFALTFITNNTTQVSIATTGIVTFTTQIKGANGTAGAPQYSFTNDATSGIRLEAVGYVCIVTAGTDRWDVSSSGNFGPVSHNAYDIGTASFAPRKVYAETQFLSGGGSAAVPGVARTNDTNTGIYWGSGSSGELYISNAGVNSYKWDNKGNVTHNQSASTTGAPVMHLFNTAAHTGLTGEAPAIKTVTASLQWASAGGTQALLRSVILAAPTYTADGAMTMTTVTTMDITGAPILDGSAGNTNAFGLRVNNTASNGAATTTAAGLQVLPVQTTGSGSITNPRAIIAGGTATIAFSNGATFNYATIAVPAHTVTVSNTAMTNTVPSVAALSLGQVTVSSSQNITNAATLYIANAPTQSGGGSITNKYAIYTAAGLNRLHASSDSDYNILTHTGSSASAGFAVYGSGTFWIGTITASPWEIRANNTSIATISSVGNWTLTPAATNTTVVALTVTQPVNTGGSPSVQTLTGGAHTSLAASTEATDVLWDLSRTVQFSTGALTLQRAIILDVNATYGFVGASTASTVVGLHITAPPTQGTNATFSTTIGLLIGNDASGATATNTIASAAGAKFFMSYWASHTLSLTGTTTLTGNPGVAALNIDQITVNTTGGGITVTNGASLYIAGAPIAGSSVTITNKYAIWADAGLCRFDGDGTNVWEVPNDTTTTAGTRAGVVKVKLTGSATQYYLFVYTIP